MAEIKIEKKKPIWPWILGLLLIGLLIYFLAFNGDDAVDDMNDNLVEDVNDDVNDMDDKTYDFSGVSNIASLNSYIENPEMGLDHEYSHGALTRIIDATKEIAKIANVDINADLEAADDAANHIMKEPYDVDHADKIKNAASIITRAIKSIQKERFPSMTSSITNLESAVESIKPGTETLEQKQQVKNFYSQAAAVLTSMTK